ncbi:hypothetical protein MPSEU_000721800 [Mayamaea pseudoterrestris]|nr:hypothetical protein MPSEU_000721800 [Mayamaea pseudoterrestris]
MSSEELGAAASVAKDDDDEASKAAEQNESSMTPTTTTTTGANKSDNNMPTAVEFEPPLACVRRILKHTLPSSTNVGKDASAAFARATGIFIIYLTSCANDFARENKRQTITANDVLAATKELDFDQFLPDMTTFLENYRATEKSKKDAKAKAAADKAGTPSKDGEAHDQADDDEDDNESHDYQEEQDEGHKRGHDEISEANDDETSVTAESAAKKLKMDTSEQAAFTSHAAEDAEETSAVAEQLEEDSTLAAE